MTPDLERQRVVEDIQNIMPHLYQYLEAACAEAADYFLIHNASIDRALASHIVRWTFLRQLRMDRDMLGIDQIEELGLSGISFWYGGYHMRVWKAGEEEVHDLTRFAASPIKSAFLAQQLTFWTWDEPEVAGNLVMLWDVDEDWHLHVVRWGPPHEVDNRFVLQWHLDVPVLIGLTHASSSEETDATDWHFERNESAMDEGRGD